MPHREDTFQISSPQHFCCSNECTFCECSVDRNLKVLRVLYLQANPDFQKIITQARNNIFHADFCISTTSLEITQLVFGPPDPPVALIMLSLN